MKIPRCIVWHGPLAIRLAAILVGLASARATAAPRPHAWQRWDHTLTSARQHDDPYADVILRVRCTGPDGRRLDGYVFWDGGQVFRIRCAFPAPGLWHWETECSDAQDAIEWILHAYPPRWYGSCPVLFRSVWHETNFMSISCPNWTQISGHEICEIVSFVPSRRLPAQPTLTRAPATGAIDSHHPRAKI